MTSFIHRCAPLARVAVMGRLERRIRWVPTSSVAKVDPTTCAASEAARVRPCSVGVSSPESTEDGELFICCVRMVSSHHPAQT